MSKVVDFPAIAAAPRDAEGLRERIFGDVLGSRLSVLHYPDGNVAVMACNPHSEAVALVSPSDARRFARAVLASADEAEAEHANSQGAA